MLEAWNIFRLWFFHLLPDWILPNGAGSFAQHHGCPDAVFVSCIPGRPDHIDPTKIPPQDGNIHLVGFKFCPDTNPFSTLEAATAQRASIITRLKTCCLRNQNKNNKVTLHIILVGVAGTIYNYY
eukprot:scaffold144124_cov19-Tisochrysis_lutea.AAC.1